MTATKTEAATERQTAKALGLSLPHFRILKALNAAGESGLTYRGIEAVTGYYSTLTALLRAESGRGTAHNESLCTAGLAKNRVYEDEPMRFFITAKGRKKLA